MKSYIFIFIICVISIKLQAQSIYDSLRRPALNNATGYLYKIVGAQDGGVLLVPRNSPAVLGSMDSGAVSLRNGLMQYWTGYKWIDFSVSIIDCNSKRISGESIYQSGFTFTTTVMNYQVLCRKFTALPTTFTLTVNPTQDRYFIVYGDTLNNIGVIAGVLASPGLADIPIQEVNTASQTVLAIYEVKAGATSPTGISNVVVYSENNAPPTEWAGSTDIATFNYSTLPIAGSVSTYIPSFTNGQYFKYTDGANHEFSAFSFFRFKIKLAAPLTTGSINIAFYKPGLWITSVLTLTNGNYGFNSSSTAEQLIVIPTPLWSVLNNTERFFSGVEFYMSGTGGSFKIDDVILQVGGQGVVDGGGVRSYNNRKDNVVSIQTDDQWGFHNVDTNYNGRKYVFYNNGVPIDSVKAFDVLLGDTCFIVSRSNDTINFNLNPYCRGVGGTLNDSRILFSANGQVKDTATLTFNRVKNTVGIGGAASDTSKIKIYGSALIANDILIHNGKSNNNTSIGIGKESLYSTTSAIYNTAIGVRSLAFHTTGGANTAVGYESSVANTTGSNNSSLGVFALRHNTTGGFNAAFGTNALRNNTTGVNNTAIGAASLAGIDPGSVMTGSYNTAIGTSSLSLNTTGSDNTSIGSEALRFNTTGIENTVAGKNAGYNVTTGSQNTLIGRSAGYNAKYRNVFIGSFAGFSNVQSDRLEISNINTSTPLIYGSFSNPYLSINGSTSSADTVSSIFSVNSTTKGTLLTRMTAAQRLAISSPAHGLIVFDTDSSSYFQNTSIGWLKMGGGTGGGGSSQWTNVTGGINYSGGKVGIGVALPTQKLDIYETYPNDGLARIGNDAAWIHMGASGAYAGLWYNEATPNAANYIFQGGGNRTFFNAPASGGSSYLAFRIGNDSKLKIQEDGSVGIGPDPATPNASAMLDVQSTSKGFLTPRMTNAQMLAISSPASGLMVINSDSSNRIFGYDGSAWRGYTFGAGGGGTTETASNGLTKVGNDIRLGGLLTVSGSTPITMVEGNYIDILGTSSGSSSGHPMLNISHSGTSGGIPLFVTNNSPNALSLGIQVNHTGAGGGIYTKAISSHGLSASSSTGIPIISTYSGDATGNNVVPTLKLIRETTGTPAIGIGQSIEFFTETSVSPRRSNSVSSKWTDVTDATRTSELYFSGYNSATQNILLQISGAGVFTLTQGLIDYADDAAAASGGIVPVNGLYRTGSIVKIRVL